MQAFVATSVCRVVFPRMKLACSSLLLLLFVAGQTLASTDEQAEIRKLYRRGLGGEKAAVEECIGKLETVLKKEPDNQLARVYLGSAYTLRSRDLAFGPKKLRTLQQGLAVMDEAVAAAPTEPKVRLARALTTSALPSILGRASESRKDFLLLAEMAGRSRQKFEEGDLQIVYYNAGLAAKADGDKSKAIELWQEGLRHSVDPALTQKLETELAQPK